MHTPPSRSSPSADVVSLPRILGLLCSVTMAVVALLGTVMPAAVATTGTPTPDPSVRSSAVTITSPEDNSFVSGTVVSLTGSKQTGSSITIPALDGTEPLCTVDADGQTRWSCANLVLPSGTIGLVAQEYRDGSLLSESSPLTLRVLGSPAFTTSGPFVNAGSLDGLGWDGSSVRIIISSPVSATQSCEQLVGDGYWFCGIDANRFASGTYKVQVEQSWPGSTTEWSPPSAVSTLTIDREVPAAPTITSPTIGQRILTQPTQYTGTGETGAYVDVYTDNTSMCTTQVQNNAWSCAGTGVGDGDHIVQAWQQDAAGNVSAPSSGVSVTFGSAATAAPSPAAVPAPLPSTTVPASPATSAPAPSTTATATPTPEASAPATTPPTATTPRDGSGSAPDRTWGTPTDYGAAIPTPAETVDRGEWPLAALLALGWVLLIALPLRLLATTLRGRRANRAPRFTGRNRRSSERRLVEQALPKISANPYFVAGGTVLAAALLAVLASGIQGELRYLRLTVAVAVGLAVLNTAAAAALRLAGRSSGLGGDIRLVPLFLAVGAATALLSRVGGIQPPLVIGIIVGAHFAMGVAAKDRARVQLAYIGSMVGLAAIAWVIGSSIGPVSGFWASAVSEMLSAICLAGFGSALLLLLPVLSLPGRVILEWSPAVWVAATAAVATMTAAVLVGDSFPTVLVCVGAAAVAVACLSVWGWTRYVQPQIS